MMIRSRGLHKMTAETEEREFGASLVERQEKRERERERERETATRVLVSLACGVLLRSGVLHLR